MHDSATTKLIRFVLRIPIGPESLQTIFISIIGDTQIREGKSFLKRFISINYITPATHQFEIKLNAHKESVQQSIEIHCNKLDVYRFVPITLSLKKKNYFHKTPRRMAPSISNWRELLKKI